MEALYFVLFLLALMCFIGAIGNLTPHPRLNLMALGLAFWVAVFVIRAAQAL